MKVFLDVTFTLISVKVKGQNVQPNRYEQLTLSRQVAQKLLNSEHVKDLYVCSTRETHLCRNSEESDSEFPENLEEILF